MALKDIPLSHLDLLMWNVNHPTGLTNITAIMFFKGSVDVKKVKKVINERIQVFDKFREKVIVKRGKPIWHEDELFDIDSHVHLLALPGKGGDQELADLISDMISTPLDYSKPLWQIHIIDKYKGGSAILWRIHHSIGDGASLMRTMLSFTDNLNDLFQVKSQYKDHEHQPNKVNWKSKFKQALELSKATIGLPKKVLEHPERIKEVIENVADTAKDLGAFLLSRSNERSIYKGELGIQKRVAWSNVIDLNDIKKIGKHFGGTVNDTLLVALTGAVRRHMEQHGQDLNIRFNVACPVDMRRNEKEFHLDNRVGVILLDLPIAQIDVEERFLTISQKTKKLKQSIEPPITYYYTQFISDFIPKRIEEASAKMLGSKLMAILSNVPGPKEPLYFTGVEVDNIMFWLPHTYDMGLGFSVISYNNKVTFGITVDPHVVKDPEVIVENFEDEIDICF